MKLLPFKEMLMKLLPFKERLEMSKEGINAALAPIRSVKAQKQAELEMCKLDEQIAVLEADIIDKLYKAAILERKKKQYQKILGELFPE